jgi:hypothetical protein
MERHTLEEAAAILGISPDALRKRIQRGDIAHERGPEGAAYVLLEPTQGDDEVRATNAARRKAEELGIDLSQVEGSGRGNLITLKDVEVAEGVQAAENTAVADVRQASEDVVSDVRRASEDAVSAVRQTAEEAISEVREGVRAASREEQETVVREAVASQAQQGTARGSTSANRRLNVVFSDSAYNTLRDLADRNDKTISDVVRDAIALQKWFNDTRRAGGRILVEERGRVREILNIR